MTMISGQSCHVQCILIDINLYLDLIMCSYPNNDKFIFLIRMKEGEAIRNIFKKSQFRDQIKYKLDLHTLETSCQAVVMCILTKEWNASY